MIQMEFSQSNGANSQTDGKRRKPEQEIYSDITKNNSRDMMFIDAISRAEIIQKS